MFSLEIHATDYPKDGYCLRHRFWQKDHFEDIFLVSNDGLSANQFRQTDVSHGIIRQDIIGTVAETRTRARKGLGRPATTGSRIASSKTIAWELKDEAIRFAEEGCDLWIKIGGVPDENLVVRPLATIERLLVASPELSKRFSKPTPSALEELPFVALDPFEGGTVHLRSSRGQSMTIRPPIALSTNNIMASRRAVLAGVGFAILPKWLAATELEEGRLFDLLPEWRASRLSLNLAYLPGRFQSLRLRTFIDHLKDKISSVPGLSLGGD